VDFSPEINLKVKIPVATEEADYVMCPPALCGRIRGEIQKPRAAERAGNITLTAIAANSVGLCRSAI
jgi:hypothetical protein